MDWFVPKFFDDVSVSWSRPDVTLHFLCKCTLTLALWTLIIIYYMLETFIIVQDFVAQKKSYWILLIFVAGVSPEFRGFAYPIISPLVLSVNLLWIHRRKRTAPFPKETCLEYAVMSHDWNTDHILSILLPLALFQAITVGRKGVYYEVKKEYFWVDYIYMTSRQYQK